MAQWRCKSTGTRNDGTPGTEDDWSDAQCYELFNLFFTHEDHISDGDIVLLDDETHSVDFLRCPDIMGSGGSVTISSRSGAASGCAISGNDGTNTDVLLNPTGASAAVNFTFNDITFTKSVTHTDNNSPNIYFTLECGDVTFNRCVFEDFTTNATNDNNTLNCLMRSQFTGAVVSTRTVTFADCTWQNISQTWNGTTNGNASPLLMADDGTDVSFTGTNTVSSITAEWTGNNSGAGCSGVFRLNGDGDLNVSGTLTFDTITLTVAHDDAANEGCVYCATTTGTATVTGTVVFNDVNTSGGSANAFGFRSNGPFDINRLEATDCKGLNATAGLGLGGIFLSQSSNADGTVDFISALRCSSRQGVVAETSGGGGMTLKSFRATDCTVTTGVIYLGGDGDAAIESGLITGTSGLAEGAPTTALNVFVQTNETTAARDATRTISQLTITDCTDESVASVYCRNVDATYSLDVTFNNCAFNAGAANEFDTNEGGSSTLNVTLTHCGYTSASLINNNLNNGTWTNTNPVVNASLGTNSDGSLDQGSPLVDNGAKWWSGTAPVGIDGEPFYAKFPSIGGKQHYVNPRSSGGIQRSTRSRIMGNVPYWAPWEEPQPKAKPRSSSRDRLAELVGTMRMPRSKK